MDLDTSLRTIAILTNVIDGQVDLIKQRDAIIADKNNKIAALVKGNLAERGEGGTTVVLDAHQDQALDDTPAVQAAFDAVKEA